MERLINELTVPQDCDGHEELKIMSRMLHSQIMEYYFILKDIQKSILLDDLHL